MHKYDYGLIGNCAYLALIRKNGNVGWMCWPKFDSSFVFGGLLDEEKGGYFMVEPEDPNYTSTQKYIENTNVLETTFESKDGSYKITDIAPRFSQMDRQYKPLMLVRKIEPIDGNPRVRVRCQPMADYGKIKCNKVFGSSHIRYEGHDQQIRLSTDISLNYVDNEQYFSLNKTRYLVLTWGAPLEAGIKDTSEQFLAKTVNYWRQWVKNTSTERFHQEAVIRSALTLKMHAYQDTGAIIAATTTSLPEFPGSTRNWDYRFCWMRDAHYTLKALNDLSHFEVLEEYAEFIENIVLSEGNRFHPLYPITNDRLPVEEILDLSGYLGKEKPVRIGNQAYEHIQNDVYGQVLTTIQPLFNDARLLDKDITKLREIVMKCLYLIDETMEEPDNGLWEFRGLRQLHCYTFLFHWAGAQAAKRIANIIGDEEMLQLATNCIKRSTVMIEKCYDDERGVYTQAVGVPHLDASLLQLINMGYLPADSEKARKHVEAMEKELKTDGGLFYRYKHEDDFGEPETTFLICAFWYVETLARIGRLDEAKEVFENLVTKGNHLGLLSEDVDKNDGSQWGNFPQTYSHVGLINASFTIARRLDKPSFLA